MTRRNKESAASCVHHEQGSALYRGRGSVFFFHVGVRVMHLGIPLWLGQNGIQDRFQGLRRRARSGLGLGLGLTLGPGLELVSGSGLGASGGGYSTPATAGRAITTSAAVPATMGNVSMGFGDGIRRSAWAVEANSSSCETVRVRVRALARRPRCVSVRANGVG